MSDNPMTINSEDRDASVSVSVQKSSVELLTEKKEILGEKNVIPEPSAPKPDPQSEKPTDLNPGKEREKGAQSGQFEFGAEPEVGIVGPATAAGDVLNDEELLDAPVKSSVAEWIEKSAAENSKSSNGGKNSNKETAVAQPTRKSQRIVSNIIKRSIKW